ncbi:MAG: type I-F CRISPR-associated protein Csy3 [Bacilli bacterium]|jgi:CRISPR-associated protein Csy3
MAKTKTMASVLAFEKKLVPSDGYLYGTTWDQRYEFAKPLVLNTKSVRGTISNRLEKKLKEDPAKLDAKIENPNLQVVDSCALELEQDTLKLHFSLKVLGNVGSPSACNNEIFHTNLIKVVDEYSKHEGFKELGKRYAINIANGRFLWRNRVGAEHIEVVVKANNLRKSWIFDSLSIPIQNFDSTDEQVNELGAIIAETLAGDKSFLILEIDAYAQIGKAQEVYPSEELVLGKQKEKSEKSKILYQLNGQAGLHSQKIGNALRTIDTWYPEFPETLVGPIAIEPYGAVTTLGRAFRTPVNKSDFYTLFDKYVSGDQLPSIDDEHYVMAVLVRGGVFGESSKE